MSRREGEPRERARERGRKRTSERASSVHRNRSCRRRRRRHRRRRRRRCHCQRLMNDIYKPGNPAKNPRWLPASRRIAGESCDYIPGSPARRLHHPRRLRASKATPRVTAVSTRFAPHLRPRSPAVPYFSGLPACPG